MSYWAALFLEFWRREENTLAYRWNVLNYDKEERNRPEWKSDMIRKSPVTGKWERYQPPGRFRMRMIVSYFAVFFCVVVIATTAVLCMLAKPWIQTTYADNATLVTFAPYIGRLVVKVSVVQPLTLKPYSSYDSALSMVNMIVLGLAYSYINVWLTLYENHQTESSFESTLIVN
jgi:hypothetical protein